MDGVKITGVEPEARSWLEERAAKHGVSLEAEVRALIRDARERERAEDISSLSEEERKARWEAVFALAIKLPPGSPDSTEMIRRDRDSR